MADVRRIWIVKHASTSLRVGEGKTGEAAHRKRLYFRMHQSARKPSFHPIFFPSA